MAVKAISLSSRTKASLLHRGRRERGYCALLGQLAYCLLCLALTSSRNVTAQLPTPTNDAYSLIPNDLPKVDPKTTWNPMTLEPVQAVPVEPTTEPGQTKLANPTINPSTSNLPNSSVPIPQYIPTTPQPVVPFLNPIPAAPTPSQEFSPLLPGVPGLGESTRPSTIQPNPIFPSAITGFPDPTLSNSSIACETGPQQVPYQPSDFLGTPVPDNTYQPCLDANTYFGKYLVPTQRPWVEWWRPFYTGGMYAPAIPVFSDVNPLTPHFLVYGDYRAAVGVHRNQGQPVRSVANRLNLDFDLRLTGTERIHAFMGPLDHNNRFTRLDFSDSRDIEFEEELDAQLDTVFFEGDLGAMTGGVIGRDAPFDLPITLGRVPLLYQNGIWMEDAIDGVAIAFPWRHQPDFNWSNYEVSLFAGFNQVTSAAFANNQQAAEVFGSAWFIEAYGGYIEADYAYLNDRDGLGRSYHNTAFAYTRRYWQRLSNSIRLLGNAGQAGPRVDRTADGLLLLSENSLVSSSPSTVVPYWNSFIGYGRPQSVARAAASGGILRNTGINFESDALTDYPTLDATASNAYGGAVGINLLSADFRRQFVVEFATLDTYGDDALSTAPGAQYAFGTRWQKALSNWTLVRLDGMVGWLDNAPDIFGTRAEFRWKF
jgi:hypothetical protein